MFLNLSASLHTWCKLVSRFFISGNWACVRGSCKCQVHSRKEAYRWINIKHIKLNATCVLVSYSSNACSFLVYEPSWLWFGITIINVIIYLNNLLLTHRKILWWNITRHWKILLWCGWHFEGLSADSWSFSVWYIAYH